MTTAPLLEARSVGKTFPGVRALAGVDFDVRAGEVHALLGENGAGKSTLVNILTGRHQPDAGVVAVAGEPVVFGSPRDATNAGIRVIHQELALVPEMSVAQNLVLGEIPLKQSRAGRVLRVVDREKIARHARDALALVGTPADPAATAKELTVAQAQLIEIARALSSSFRALILDEPTSALSAIERDELFQHLRRFRKTGVGILYISHRLEEIIEIADRVTILRDGRVVARLAREELSLARIVELMSGTSRKAVPVHLATVGDQPLLEVSSLTLRPRFSDVSFVLRPGEVVGLTGLVGAGRTEVARAIFGATSFESGEIRFAGGPVAPRSPRDAIELGIGYVTEDRKTDGIVHQQSVRDNVLIGVLARRATAAAVLGRAGRVKRAAADRIVADAISGLGIRPADPRVLAGALSGGNQQKVVLARWLASKVRVLLLDEPTRGIDVASKREIWALIRRLAAGGMAMLAISSEVPELLENADRILVMKAGRIVGEVAHEGATEAEVVVLAGGRN